MSDRLDSSVEATLHDVEKCLEFADNAVRKRNKDSRPCDISDAQGVRVEHADRIRDGEFGLRVGDRGVPVRLHSLVHVAEFIGNVHVVSQAAANIRVQDRAGVGDYSKSHQMPSGISELRSLLEAPDRQVQGVAGLGQI